MKTINLILTILTILCLIYFLYLTSIDIESFENDKLIFKRTKTYDLIYHNSEKNYSIWSPRIIGDYYPLGHVFSHGKNAPNKISILVKSSTNNSKDRPLKYDLETVITKNGTQLGSFWSPVPEEGYIALGHIYHPSLPKGKLPSKHKHVRCIKLKYGLPTSINNILINDKSNKSQLWSIHKSNYFLSNNSLSAKEPNQKVYSINNNYLTLEQKLKTKKTTSYKLIYSTYNKLTNKYLSIWRPLAIKGYVSIGDIILDKNAQEYDPNDKLETIVVEKDKAKIPEGYGTNYLGHIKKQNKIEVTFWKPDCPVGYGCIGYVANLGSNEPIDPDLVYCIPLEYFKDSEKKIDAWNSTHMSNNRISLWKDENNFFISNNNYSYHTDLDLKIDEKFIDYEKDILDKKTIISLNYELDEKNTEIYNSDVREQLYRHSIISRLGIKPYRLGYFKFNKKKIQIEINPRPAGSKEIMIVDIIKNLKSLIKNKFQVENQKKDGFIAQIISLQIESEDDQKYVNLDNSKFYEAKN